jgi:zinc D-Ala-D-Ala carboxypeptidase
MITASHWKLVEAEHWPWKDFSPYEMSCKGDGSLKVDEDFMDVLQAIRNECGFPMTVASGYRSPAYNAEVSETGGNGPHTTGRAADIRVWGNQAHRLLEVALKHGIKGIGISQKGAPGARFIHLDMCDNTVATPRKNVWSY